MVDPVAITTGSDGNIWFIEQTGNAIGMINPTTDAMAGPFSNGLPANAVLAGITSGPNGDLWFTESNPNPAANANAIGMLDPSNPTQAIQSFVGTKAAPITPKSAPTGIASANGELWFTQPLTDQIGELDPGTGIITEYSAPPAMKDVQSQIVLAPDGYLWFEESGAIGIFDPKTASMVTEVGLPGGSNESPSDITVGPDGNIWYTAILNSAENPYAVGEIGINSPHTIQETPPGLFSSTTEPVAITAGPDGNVWVAVTSNGTTAGTIDKIDPANLMVIGETIPIPTSIKVPTPDPVAITAGPDGNLWFTDAGGAIGVVNDTQLVVTAQPAPDVSVNSPFSVTVTDEYTSGVTDKAFKGSVKLTLSTNPGGSSFTPVTMTAGSGVAMFPGLTLNNAGTGYIFTATSSATNGPTSMTTNSFDVVVGPATHLVVTTEPPLSVVTGTGFGVVVQDEYVSVSVDAPFNGNVTIALGANPGGSSFTPVTVTAVNGVATFTGLTLNNAGNGYTLQASSAGLTTQMTQPFDVTPPPPPPPPPPTIVGESVVFTQKVNKKTHKPMGPKTLSGYTITFDTAMDQTALGNGANYFIGSKVVKTVRGKGGKKMTKTSYSRVNFTVSAVTGDSVTLKLAGKPTFSKGGQLTAMAAGLDDTSGVFLAANGVFTISKGGKQIS